MKVENAPESAALTSVTTSAPATLTESDASTKSVPSFRSWHLWARIDTNNVFPSKLSFAIFIAYISLFIGQGIFVTASQENGGYSYNTTIAILCTEVIKLVVAAAIYLRSQSLNFGKLCSDIISHRQICVYYLVPSGLYAAYNNLAFYNLSNFDPTTYFLLLQFRVVITAVIFQILFNKSLTRKQWLSLILLTIGCIVKEIKLPGHNTETETKSVSWYHFTFNLSLLAIQALCSCFAGVYNEYLLKDKAAEIDIMMQNIYMYIDSIFCNFLVILYKGQLSTVFSLQEMYSIFEPKVIVVICNNAAIGIVTSLFLKHLNSILKSYASIIELMFTAILSLILFGIPITIFTVIAIVIVSYAMLLYVQNPVVNTGRLPLVESKQPK